MVVCICWMMSLYPHCLCVRLYKWIPHLVLPYFSGIVVQDILLLVCWRKFFLCQLNHVIGAILFVMLASLQSINVHVILLFIEEVNFPLYLYILMCGVLLELFLVLVITGLLHSLISIFMLIGYIYFEPRVKYFSTLKLFIRQ